MAATKDSASDHGHEVVQRFLTSFVTQYIPGTSLEAIDDIILSYMLGILEDLGREDGFELDSFVEMMQAYIPGFEGVDSAKICDWMFTLADELTNPKEQENTSPRLLPSCQSLCTIKENTGVLLTANSVRGTLGDVTRRSPMQSDRVSDESSNQREKEDNSDDDDVDAQVRQLLEMFPSSRSVDARRCLATAKGEIDNAVQLMLLEMEDADNAPTVTKDEWNTSKSSRQQDEKKIRDSILQKYGYVDTRDDSISHKPAEPKREQKKMVRYLNGAVCTTKGEKFVEIKKPITDEIKKTFINLKPARKYHFH